MSEFVTPTQRASQKPITNQGKTRDTVKSLVSRFTFESPKVDPQKNQLRLYTQQSGITQRPTPSHSALSAIPSRTVRNSHVPSALSSYGCATHLKSAVQGFQVSFLTKKPFIGQTDWHTCDREEPSPFNELAFEAPLNNAKVLRH